MSGYDWRVFGEDFAREAARCGFRGESIARVEEDDILAWVRGEGRPRVYLSAGIHGDEPAGPLALMELLRLGVFDERLCWAIVPILNPSGLRAGTRENEAGVDLNRDYLLRETTEVRGHVEWLEANPVPDLFVSLHEDWETTGFYLYEIRLGEEGGWQTQEVLTEVQQVFALEKGPFIDGHEVREAGWIFHGVEPDEPEGWPEAIFLSRMGCPLSFTLETPSSEPLEERVKCHVSAVKRLISSYLESF